MNAYETCLTASTFTVARPEPILYIDHSKGACMAKELYEYDTEKKEIKPAKGGSIRMAWRKLDKWNLFKKIVSVAAGGCASAMVKKYLQANLPEAQSTAEAVVTGVGVYFVTGVVADKVSEYTAKELDDWKDSIVAAKDEIGKEAEDGRDEA